MGVGVQRHADGAVSEEFLHHLRVDAHGQEDRRRAVPQVMKAHGWVVGLREQRSQHLAQPLGLQKSPGAIAEDQIVFLPGASVLQACLTLPRAVLLEGLGYELRQGDPAPAPGGFGLGLHEALPDVAFH